MKRREFITFLGGAAAMPLAAHAQQAERVRRVGVLMGIEANDAEAEPRKAVFEQELEKLGLNRRNIHIEYRFAGADPDRMQLFAKELIELPSDVIVGHNTRPVATILQQTRSIPIVFVAVADHVCFWHKADIAAKNGPSPFKGLRPAPTTIFASA